MLRIGLTGSIGMGKSTMGKLFAEAGVPVNDSDAVVHDLYAGEAAPLVDAAFPGTMKEGAVDRQELARQLAGSADGFKRLEAIVHPLVRKREAEFIERERQRGSPMVLLDIPLLFETGAESRVDVIVVVSCDPQIQRERVLARPGMTVEKFDMILARQTPDAEKRARADYVIDTAHSIETARKRVAEIVSDLKRRLTSGDFLNA
ncbi:MULTISPECIES: dephospho-CoA kinase [Rhizobium]|jgi:dephospho-CoA kinase|uniref:dephospho-CoA kinase n=1 Tax=Rhizobium TaxID=379 RepID=UPI0003705465|nr:MULTISPECIES: dephospho-CoA kinase [unclassified Rhizobium]MBD9448797.1 dephospho-CoA kinase [Rhizobium sp. RHZ01]MBD9450583.1 dephospho-CoA kinase [Rhizobium sp. RHZ02]NMN71261.1 dephospho-CoA kinase [Rhizobium sp. 57MFTsu3.2]